MNFPPSVPGSSVRDPKSNGIPDPPRGLVAEVRELLKGPVLNRASEIGAGWVGEGFIVAHGYEDLSRDDRSFGCHRKVGRVFLLLREGAHHFSLIFTGCANVPTGSWMIESHVSIDRMPPPSVSKCTAAEGVDSFAMEEISGFLLSVARYRLLQRQIADSWDASRFWDELYFDKVASSAGE